ncbi:Uncharacterised protein [Acinetobacter baumannii]|nr:Uncharacterised protein [Acinetobacter baumannii]SSS37431.1 Uncharacterised protein [Acinetobacter baumannii]SSU11259.1 Uncharacterised protein [Acinetobacter baumannii]SSU44634.1 Uncharacterised protein [Acinetobacter baumannii]
MVIQRKRSLPVKSSVQRSGFEPYISAKNASSTDKSSCANTASTSFANAAVFCASQIQGTPACVSIVCSFGNKHNGCLRNQSIRSSPSTASITSCVRSFSLISLRPRAPAIRVKSWLPNTVAAAPRSASFLIKRRAPTEFSPRATKSPANQIKS